MFLFDQNQIIHVQYVSLIFCSTIFQIMNIQDVIIGKFSIIVISNARTNTNYTGKYNRLYKEKEKETVLLLFFGVFFKFQHVIVLFTLISIIAIVLAVLLTRTKAKKPKQAILRWNSTGITVAGVTDQPGKTSDKLSTPRGIDLDWSNALYIADDYNSRVQKYSKNSSVGETVAGDGSGIAGSGAGLLSHPFDVVIDLNENVSIADSYNQRIQQWTQGSSMGTTIADTTGVVNNSANTLNFPYGIAYDSITHGIYVSDSMIVRCFELDAHC